jgi:hypothetical protein
MDRVPIYLRVESSSSLSSTLQALSKVHTSSAVYRVSMYLRVESSRGEGAEEVGHALALHRDLRRQDEVPDLQRGRVQAQTRLKFPDLQ